MISHLKDVTGSTVTHFFLCESPNDLAYADYTYMSKEEKKIYNKEKILIRDSSQVQKEEYYRRSHCGSFDRVFILKNGKRANLIDENNFSEIETQNMTDAQLSSAFIRNQTSRKKDRVFVNKFMEMVA